MTPSDLSLYNKTKKYIYKKNPKHSAYRSGMLVKTYKKRFAKKHGTRKKPYLGKQSRTRKGLKRWFAEEWVNQRGEVGYKNKNDIYRPTNRITKKTPITHKELTKKEIKTARTKKYRKGRVKRFRKKKGGAWTPTYKDTINCARPKGFSQRQYCAYGRKTRKNRRDGEDK